MTHEVTTGSIFDDLDYDPGEAEQLKLKAALFDTIIDYMWVFWPNLNTHSGPK